MIVSECHPGAGYHDSSLLDAGDKSVGSKEAVLPAGASGSGGLRMPVLCPFPWTRKASMLPPESSAPGTARAAFVTPSYHYPLGVTR